MRHGGGDREIWIVPQVNGTGRTLDIARSDRDRESFSRRSEGVLILVVRLTIAGSDCDGRMQAASVHYAQVLPTHPHSFCQHRQTSCYKIADCVKPLVRMDWVD